MGHFQSSKTKRGDRVLIWLMNLQETKIKLSMFMTYHSTLLRKFYGQCSLMYLVSTCPSIKRGRSWGKCRLLATMASCCCFHSTIFRPSVLFPLNHMQRSSYWPSMCYQLYKWSQKTIAKVTVNDVLYCLCLHSEQIVHLELIKMFVFVVELLFSSPEA